MITLPGGTTSDEQVVARFLNSMFSWQVVTDGPDATCPECGYPERHRIYDVKTDSETLTADGCPSCETSRMPDREVCTCASAYGEFVGCKLHGIEADDTNREDGDR